MIAMFGLQTKIMTVSAAEGMYISMNERERQAFKRMKDALIRDVAIDDILEKLNDDEMELIGDSLIAALNGGCDEFFHRLFEELVPNRIEDDKSGKWKAVQAFLQNIW